MKLSILSKMSRMKDSAGSRVPRKHSESILRPWNPDIIFRGNDPRQTFNVARNDPVILQSVRVLFAI